VSIDLDALRADLRGMIDDMPAVIEWLGVPYTGSVTNRRRSDSVTEFAVDSEIEVDARLVVADLPAGGVLPKPRDRVIIGGLRYEVMTVDLERDGVGIRLGLREDRRNRP
jgi:hypothetical protein